jgi:hypothetical protein
LVAYLSLLKPFRNGLVNQLDFLNKETNRVLKSA